MAAAPVSAINGDPRIWGSKGSHNLHVNIEATGGVGGGPYGPMQVYMQYEDALEIAELHCRYQAGAVFPGH